MERKLRIIAQRFLLLLLLLLLLLPLPLPFPLPLLLLRKIISTALSFLVVWYRNILRKGARLNNGEKTKQSYQTQLGVLIPTTTSQSLNITP